jgi:hypothetical protein
MVETVDSAKVGPGRPPGQRSRWDCTRPVCASRGRCAATAAAPRAPAARLTPRPLPARPPAPPPSRPARQLADRLDRAVAAAGRAEPLAVAVQVNTSGEESKHGVDPPEVVALAAHVARACPHLRLAGLMTIGMPDYSSRPENFECLAKCRWVAAPERRQAAFGQPEEPARTQRSGRLGRPPAPLAARNGNPPSPPTFTHPRPRDEVAAELGIPAEELELSMGMSGDFEAAVSWPPGFAGPPGPRAPPRWGRGGAAGRVQGAANAPPCFAPASSRP